jgi:hypothetical protein
MRKFYPALFLATLCVFSLPFAPQAHATPKPKAKATPKPTPTPDPSKNPAVMKVYNDLRELKPTLTIDEVVRTSQADLRSMYSALFSKQGMKLLEAKQKAATVPLP